MNSDKERELKKVFRQRLHDAGYNSIQALVELDPPTIMNIIGSNLPTAENLFISALKAHMKALQENYEGASPFGINRALTNLGFKTIQALADANPTTIAMALKINLDHAGEIVLYAMELSLATGKVEKKSRESLLAELDKELSHKLDLLKGAGSRKKPQKLVDESVQRIYETFRPPSEEVQITPETREEIKKAIEQLMVVFLAFSGFALYNRRGEGLLRIANDNRTKQTLANIHDSIPSIFWKINFLLAEREEYGWISAQPHLVWIAAIREQSMRRQLAYLAVFVFEGSSKEGVRTATPTIRGVTKEIEKIIYGSVSSK